MQQNKHICLESADQKAKMLAYIPTNSKDPHSELIISSTSSPAISINILVSLLSCLVIYSFWNICDLAISNYIEKYGLMYWHMHRRNSIHMNKRLYEATKCEICETLAFVDLHAVNQ